jgi:hypothetical protein
MCSLQYAAQLEKHKSQEASVPSNTEEKMQELIDLIDLHMAAY